ncbi:hypothetical protein K1719_009466 [Acacia pycnantha]|nr:hypothetical protein K1719_009466 [Acacia pycnantha]
MYQIPTLDQEAIQVFLLLNECLNLLCLHCGRFEHVKEACGDFFEVQKRREKAGRGEKEVVEEKVGEEGKEVTHEESPWKVVHKPWTKRSIRIATSAARGGEVKGRIGDSRIKGKTQGDGKERVSERIVNGDSSGPCRVRGGLMEKQRGIKKPQGYLKKSSADTEMSVKKYVEEVSTSSMLVDEEEAIEASHLNDEGLEEGEPKVEDVRGAVSSSRDGDASVVSELLEISERFGWDNDDKAGWGKINYELLGTSHGGRIPRLERSEDDETMTMKQRERMLEVESEVSERRKERRGR